MKNTQVQIGQASPSDATTARSEWHKVAKKDQARITCQATLNRLFARCRKPATLCYHGPVKRNTGFYYYCDKHASRSMARRASYSPA